MVSTSPISAKALSSAGEERGDGDIAVFLPSLEASFSSDVGVSGTIGTNLPSLEFEFEATSIEFILDAGLPVLQVSVSVVHYMEAEIGVSLPSMEGDLEGEVWVQGPLHTVLPMMTGWFESDLFCEVVTDFQDVLGEWDHVIVRHETLHGLDDHCPSHDRNKELTWKEGLPISETVNVRVI